MNFSEYYFVEEIGIDSSRPPVKQFKNKFMAWDENVRLQFVKAVDAWHGTTMQDNNPQLLITFSKEHVKEMKEYQEWLKSLLTEDSFELYRGFYGDFANKLAEDVWTAIKNKSSELKVELKEYTPWSTAFYVSRSFSDAIILKHVWTKDNVFHADAGRGFLLKTEYKKYIKLSRTEREIVIYNPDGYIMINPLQDVTLRGKFRSRQLRLNKKELNRELLNFQNKLEIGKKYLPKKDIDLPPYWQDILDQGGLKFLGSDETGLKFEWPDKSIHVVKKDNIEWLNKFLNVEESK